jgi:hypothetical protein
MIILGTNSIKDTSYNVANSCRFDAASSACMHKTPSGSGNRRTFTFSTWVKKCKAGGYQDLYSAYVDANNISRLLFWDGDEIVVTNKVGGSFPTFIRTNAVFRDPSAWYHVCIAIDTTDSTETDRVKIYVNNSQITSLAQNDYPSQNEDFFLNHTNEHNIGQQGDDDSALYFGGYLAETVMIDGLQLTPTSFGEFSEDSPNIWMPKDVSGLTFGTNGFYLDYEDSSNLGNDANGGTDFTEVNLAATDQATDTCTNNFAIGNSLLKRGSSTVSEGNLKIQDSAGAWQGLSTTIGASAGKWYCEWKVTAVNSNAFGVVGEASYSISNNGTAIGFTTPSVSILQNGDRYIDNSGASYSGSFTTNDIIGCAMDLDNHKVYFSKGGEWSNGSGAWDSTTFNSSVGAISLSQTSGFYFFGHSVHTATSEANYGNPPYSISSGNADANGYGNFEYAVPSGYYALNTKNLAEYGG